MHSNYNLPPSQFPVDEYQTYQRDGALSSGWPKPPMYKLNENMVIWHLLPLLTLPTFLEFWSLISNSLHHYQRADYNFFSQILVHCSFQINNWSIVPCNIKTPTKLHLPTAFGEGDRKGVLRLLLKSFWFSRKTVNLLILTRKWELSVRSRNTTTSSWYAGHQTELSWRPNNPSGDWMWHWTTPAYLWSPISYSCLPCSFTSH